MKKVLVLIFFGAPFLLLHIAAQDSLPKVVSRYEQILARNPRPGIAFEKVYQHFFADQGLDELAVRWQRLEGVSKTSAGNYLILQGMLAERREFNDLALALYRQAGEKMPKNVGVWRLIGDLETRAGRLTEASGAFEQALKLKPSPVDRPELFRKLARVRERNLDQDGAISAWRQLADEYPDVIHHIEEVSRALMNMGEFEDARRLFHRVSDLAGDDPYMKVTVGMRLGQLELELGNRKEAISIYENSLNWVNESSWIHKELRSRIEAIYRAEDDLPGLAQYYIDWLGNHARDLEAMVRLSKVFGELDRTDESIQYLKKVTVMAPDRYDWWQLLARRHLENEQTDEAIQILTRLTRTFPESMEYRAEMGEALWQHYLVSRLESDRGKAIEAWRGIASENGSNISRFLLLAEIFEQHQLSEEALEQYRQAVRLDPYASDLKEQMAHLLFDMDRQDEAWGVLEGLVESDNAPAENYLLLARIQKKQGEKEALLKTLKEGTTHHPDHYNLVSRLWQAYMDDLDWKSASELIDELLHVAPNDYFISEIETRHLQVLKQLKQFEPRLNQLSGQLNEAGALSESELRLLIRMSAQTGDLNLMKEALNQARNRFSASVSVAELEVDYLRRAGRIKDQIQALQALIQLKPAREFEYLKRIVRVYQNLGDSEKAIQAAQILVKESPANAQAFLIYAEVCFSFKRHDEGIRQLNEAIHWADRPNEIRNRLARAYLDIGEPGRAKEVYEKAFAEEQDLALKVRFLKPLTDLYLQEGRLAELIESFRTKQKQEGNGSRYGLYLAEIFRQTEDYASARIELSRSLLKKPGDIPLLENLIQLALVEGNASEEVRFRKLLVAADSSATRHLQLAVAYLRNGQPEEAMKKIRAHRSVFLNDQSLWREFMPLLKRHQLAGEVSELIRQSMQDSKTDWKKTLALAEFQIAQKDDKAAFQTLLEFYQSDDFETEANGSTLEIEEATTAKGIWFFMNQTRHANRLVAAQSASASSRTLFGTRATRSSFSSAQRAAGITSSGKASFRTPDDLQQARDFSLTYLSMLASKTGTEKKFIAQLSEFMNEREYSRAERILAYALMEARKPLLEQIRAQAESPEPDLDLDTFCMLMIHQNYLVAGAASIPDDLVDYFELFQKRVSQAYPRLAANAALFLHQIYLAKGRTELARTKLQQGLDQIYFDIPQQVLASMILSVQGGSFEQVEWVSRNLPHDGFHVVTPPLQVALLELPVRLSAKLGVTGWQADKILQMIAQALAITYPKVAPLRQGRNLRYVTISNSSFRQLTPQPSRYLDYQWISRLRRLYGNLASRNQADALLKQLEHQIALLPESQQIYPKLISACFHCFAGHHQEAIQPLKEVLNIHDDDDLRITLALLLAETKKPDEAIIELTRVSGQGADVFLLKHSLLLRLSSQTGDADQMKKSAGALAALSLTSADLTKLAGVFRELKLEKKAAEITARARTRFGSPASKTSLLQQAIRANKSSESIQLARQVLGRVKSTSIRGNLGQDRTRTEAYNALKKFNGLEGYIKELEKQHKNTPNSIRLCLLLAESKSYVDFDLAVPYYDRIVKLQPTNYSFHRKLARLYVRNKKYKRTVELFENLLQQDRSGTLLGSQYDILQAYNGAGQIESLMERIAVWEPVSNSGEALQLVNLCRSIGQSEVDKGNWRNGMIAWKKGVSLSSQNSMSLELSILKLLVEEKQFETASEEMEQFLFRDSSNGQFLLGFRNRKGTGFGSWNSQIRQYNYRRAMTPIVEFLELGQEIGALSPLIEKTAERLQDERSASSLRDLFLLMTVINQDERFADLWNERLSGINEATFTAEDQRIVSLIIDQLDFWKEGVSLVFPGLNKLTEVYRSQAYGGYSLIGNQVRTLRAALKTGQSDLALKTLEETVLQMELELVTGRIPQNQIGPCIEYALRMNQMPIAERLIKVMQSLSVKTSSSALRKRVGDLRKMIRMAKGEETNPMPTIWFTGGDASRFEASFTWKIGPPYSSSVRNSSTPVLTLHDGDFSAIDGRYDLEILAGSEAGKMERIAYLEKVNYQGNWTGVLPVHAGFIRARLHLPDSDRTVNGPVSQFVCNRDLWLSPPVEPSLNEGGFPGRRRSVEGWQDMMIRDFTIDASVADLKEPAVLFDIGKPGRATYSGNAIPLKPEEGLFISAWMRSATLGNQIRIGVRFFNNTGQMIKEVFSDYANAQHWQHRRLVLTRSKTVRSRTVNIPDGAIKVSPIIDFSNGVGWASDLFLGIILPSPG